MNPEEIVNNIKASLPDAEVRVNDYTGGGDHFEVVVLSDQFEGKSRVKRHQMVYKSLGEAMDGPIHALALKTMTMLEFKDVMQNQNK